MSCEGDDFHRTRERIVADPARIERLLNDVYGTLKALNRCGLTLDPDCPAGVWETWEAVGEFLYPGIIDAPAIDVPKDARRDR